MATYILRSSTSLNDEQVKEKNGLILTTDHHKNYFQNLLKSTTCFIQLSSLQCMLIMLIGCLTVLCCYDYVNNIPT